MIYTLYKSNYRLVLLGLPLVIVLLWMGQLVGGFEASAIQNATPLFSLVKHIFPNQLSEQFFAMAIIVFSGVLLNATINKEQFFEKHTYLPALTYIFVMSLFPKYQHLHPIILANFFVILSIRRLFHIRRAVDARRMIFDAGFFLGISALFYEYYIAFYLLAWGTLSVLRPFVWREHFMGLFGLVIPLVALLFYQYMTDNIPDFVGSIQPKNQYSYSFIADSWFSLGIGIGISLTLLIVGGRSFIIRQKRSSLRFKRISNIILFMGLIVLILSGLFALLDYRNPAIFMCAVLCSFLLTFYFFYTRKQKIAAVLFYLTIAYCTLTIYYEQLENIFN